MKREKWSEGESALDEFLKCLLLTAAIVAGVLLCVCHASCRLTSQGIQALGAEESPRILDANVTGARTVKVDFSKPVQCKSALVSELGEGQKAALDLIGQDAVSARAESLDGGKSLLYVFDKSARIGGRYQLFSEIKDSRGNTLSFALPFDGFNERQPICALVEVQPKKKGATAKVAAESPYVIIQALEDGNLFGIDLYCAKAKAAYPLPAVEVKAGEKIALHLKPTEDAAACKSELENDLSLAKSGRSSAAWRDIFFDIGAKSITGTNDVIFLRGRNSGKIIDALSYYTMKGGKSSWSLHDELRTAIAKGAWTGEAGIEGSVEKKDSDTRPLVRKSVPSAAAWRPAQKGDWEVSAKSVYN